MKKLPLSLLILPLFFGVFLVPHHAEAKSVTWNDPNTANLWAVSLDSNFCFWDCQANFDMGNPVTGNRWIGTFGMSGVTESISHSATIFNNSSGTLLNDGDSVPVGASISFMPAANQSTDISWFEQGNANDSPYGTWGGLGAAVTPGNYVSTNYVSLATFDNYVSFNVTPTTPTITHGGTASLSCDSGGFNCTVNGAGTITATITYPATTGKYYAAYVRSGTISPWYENWTLSGTRAYPYPLYKIPLANGCDVGAINVLGKSQVVLDNTACATDQSNVYVVQVPAISIPFTLSAIDTCTMPPAEIDNFDPVGDTAKACGALGYDKRLSISNYGASYDTWTEATANGTNNGQCAVFKPGSPGIMIGLFTSSTCTVKAPNPPSVTPPASCTTGTAGTYTFSATDPANMTVRYGVDWNNDASVDEWVPASGYVTSGTAQSTTHTFNSTGTQAFKVLTQNSNGANSGWTASSISCTAPVVAPTVLLSASPASVVVGNSSTLTWSTSNNPTSCSIDNGVGTVSTSGGTKSVTPGSTTTYTLTCTNSAGSGTDTATVTIVPLPDLTSSLVAGHENLTVQAGVPLTLDATVANTAGGPTSGPFTTTFWTNTSQQWAGGQYTEFTSGVPSGFPANYTEVDGPQLPVTRTFATPGTYYYQACANRDHTGAQSVSQSNPNNDCTAWGTITVTPPPAADLTAGAVTPASATVGSATTFSSTISNTGNAASGSFPVLYQITDGSGNPVALVNSSYLSVPQGGTAPSSAPYTFASAGTYKVRACANNNTSWVNIVTESNYANNCGAYTTVTVTAQTPTCTFTANPTVSIPSTLTWSSTNATSCTGGGFSTGSATSGSQVVNTAGSYTLSCTGSGGSCSASVNVASCTNPTVAISASQARVTPGSTVSITYNGTGVQGTCTVTGPGAPGSVTPSACTLPSNSFTTPPLNTQTMYTITCGAASQSVTINVVPKFTEF